MTTPAETSTVGVRPSAALSSQDFAVGFIAEDLRNKKPGAGEQQPDFFAGPDGFFTRVWKAATQMVSRQYRRWTGQATFLDVFSRLDREKRSEVADKVLQEVKSKQELATAYHDNRMPATWQMLNVGKESKGDSSIPTYVPRGRADISVRPAYRNGGDHADAVPPMPQQPPPSTSEITDSVDPEIARSAKIARRWLEQNQPGPSRGVGEKASPAHAPRQSDADARSQASHHRTSQRPGSNPGRTR